MDRPHGKIYSRAVTQSNTSNMTPITLARKGPQMSRRIPKLFAFVLAAVLLAAAATCLVSILHEPFPGSPTLAFTGREPGPAFRAAGFYITNRCPRSIFLWQVHVEAIVEGAWKTVAEEPLEFSPCLEPGQSKLNFSPVLEPKDHRKIIVHWPEDCPWRVAIQYYKYRRGVNALVAKCQWAWRNRTLKHWHDKVLNGPYVLMSEEVKR